MTRAALAIPNFLWWGFKRAGWVERAIVVTGFLLLLGLAWPADDSDAAYGGPPWESDDPSYEFEGDGWADLGSNRSAYENAISDAADTWSSDSDFNPSVSSAASDNDIHWGDDPDGWNGCEAPTGSGGSWAKECTRTRSGYIIESDIVFNEEKTWNTGRLQGIATHEFGHSGALAHDSSGATACLHSFQQRWTMCPTATASNASWWSTPETHDISDMNYWY